MPRYIFAVDVKQTAIVTVEADSEGDAKWKMHEDPHIWHDILGYDLRAIDSYRFVRRIEDNETTGDNQ